MSNENIDSNGFRKNVGIVLYNSDGNVLLASRAGKKGWQFPQGGMYCLNFVPSYLMGMAPVDLDGGQNTGRMIAKKSSEFINITDNLFF